MLWKTRAFADAAEASRGRHQAPAGAPDPPMYSGARQFPAMLPIIYQDEALVAIHKPAGLLVHRSNLDRHETRFAVQLLRDQLGRRVSPVHRLDRATSGVLLFAFEPEVASHVGRQFAEDQGGQALSGAGTWLA